MPTNSLTKFEFFHIYEKGPAQAGLELVVSSLQA